MAPPYLETDIKTETVSVSARAIKLSLFYPDPMTSFAQIHELTNRAVPEMMRIYKMAIQLHTLYNSNDHSLEWVSLNENQILPSEEPYVHDQKCPQNPTEPLILLWNPVKTKINLIKLLNAISKSYIFKCHFSSV